MTSNSEKIRIMQAHEDGQAIEWHDNRAPEYEWEICKAPSWSWCQLDYRIASEHAKRTLPTIPWEAIKPEWRFYARDKNGSQYFYENQPDGVGNAWKLISGDVVVVSYDAVRILTIDPGTCDWRDSLMERPE